jgi:hypothetical protein
MLPDTIASPTTPMTRETKNTIKPILKKRCPGKKRLENNAKSPIIKPGN